MGWLSARAPWRGSGWDGGPLKPLPKVEKPRRIVAGELYLGPPDANGCPTVLGLGLYGGSVVVYTPLGNPTEDWQTLVARLAAWSDGGSLLTFWDGQRSAFHILVRQYAKLWARAGWRVQPLAVGSEIRALIVSRKGCQITLCDAQAMSGTRDTTLARWCDRWGAEPRGDSPDVERLWRALDRFQRTLVRTLGVALRPTIGMVAVRAFRACLPNEPYWLRPAALMSALCREGGAYRGGWVYARPYRGQAWRVDANKLYSWSLSRGVPVRSALASTGGNGAERPGVFCCRVEGQADLPVTLPAWHKSEGGFRKRRAADWQDVTCLSSEEFPGLRSLGLRITPLWGEVHTDWLDTRPFTDRLFALQSDYPRGSAQHQAAKGLGNALVGKLGENPQRVDLCYAEALPSSEWWPFLTVDNEPVEGLWVRRRVQPSPHQRIDAATVVTSRARSKVYTWAAEWLGTGGQIAHIDTDGLVVTSDPRGIMPLDDSKPGAFRLEVCGGECVVVGPKTYTLAGVTYAAGVPEVDPSVISLASYRGLVVVERKVLHAPWQAHKMTSTSPFTIRAK